MKKLFLLFASCLFLGCATSKHFSIQLEENPTTGYSLVWQQEGDGVVALVKERYVQDSGEVMMVGRGGKHSFAFKGVKAGKVTLSFQQARPWEPKEMALDEAVFHLTVKEDLSITL